MDKQLDATTTVPKDDENCQWCVTRRLKVCVLWSEI